MLNKLSKLFGGNKGGGAAKADAFLAALKSQLGISDSQSAQIESAMRMFFQDRKAMKQAGDREGMQQKKQQLFEQIKSVLTPEQLEKFNKNLEQFKTIIKT